MVLGEKYSAKFHKKATVIGFDGKHKCQLTEINLILGQIDEIDFSFDYGTSVAGACSVIYNNRAYIIGGSTFEKKVKINNLLKFLINFQVSRVEGCNEMKYYDSLDYDFNQGKCGTFMIDSSESLLLCFDVNSPKTCHW